MRLYCLRRYQAVGCRHCGWSARQPLTGIGSIGEIGLPVRGVASGAAPPPHAPRTFRGRWSRGGPEVGGAGPSRWDGPEGVRSRLGLVAVQVGGVDTLTPVTVLAHPFASRKGRGRGSSARGSEGSHLWRSRGAAPPRPPSLQLPRGGLGLEGVRARNAWRPRAESREPGFRSVRPGLFGVDGVDGLGRRCRVIRVSLGLPVVLSRGALARGFTHQEGLGHWRMGWSRGGPPARGLGGRCTGAFPGFPYGARRGVGRVGGPSVRGFEWRAGGAPMRWASVCWVLGDTVTRAGPL